MEANARNLGNLQNKVESVHQASVDDRDVVSKAKQEQLRGKYIHIYQCSHGHKHLFPNRPFHFCNCSILLGSLQPQPKFVLFVSTSLAY